MTSRDSEKVEIIDMEEEHLDPIAEISRRCFSKIYVFDWYENAGNMLKLSKQGKVVVRVIKKGEAVIGFGNLRSWPVGGWIDLIAIHPEDQKQGFGRMLLADLKAKAKANGYWKISLIVSANEKAALSFYTKNGFVVVGEMVDQIKRGVNGILMSCIIDYEFYPNQD